MEDYLKLEGKDVFVKAENETYEGTVALIDPDIGITIVHKDRPKDYLLCLIGNSSPKFKDGDQLKPEQTAQLFENIIEQISEGIVSMPYLVALYSKITKTYVSGFDSGDRDACPFK